MVIFKSLNDDEITAKFVDLPTLVGTESIKLKADKMCPEVVNVKYIDEKKKERVIDKLSFMLRTSKLFIKIFNSLSSSSALS
jgi:hypothetical protein